MTGVLIQPSRPLPAKHAARAITPIEKRQRSNAFFEPVIPVRAGISPLGASGMVDLAAPGPVLFP